MASPVDKLMRNYSACKSERSNWEEQWQQIADYGLGQRDFTGRPTQGRQRNTLIYDGTFEEAADDLAAALVQLNLNPFSRWMWIEPEDSELMQDPEVAQHFELETEQIYRIFSNPSSGFYTAIHESFKEFAAFGNMAFFEDIHEEKNQIQFQSLPLTDCFIQEDGYGFPEIIYIRKMMKAFQAFDLWGDKVSKEIIKALNSGSHSAEFEFVQCIYPNKMGEKLGFTKSERPYLSVIFDTKSKTIVEKSGFDEKPWQFSRASKDPGEVYGRGPGQKALPDCRMLNRMARTLLVASEKAADPTLMVADDGVIGHPTTEPNGIMVVRNTNTNQAPVQYLMNTSRMDLPQERFQTVKEQIRSKFYADVLGGIQDPRLNVNQTLEVQGTIVRRLGPMANRIQNEFAEPCVQRVYGLADSLGLLPPKPSSIEGVPVKLVYISPAARAQLSADAQAILGTVGAAAEWSQLDQDVIDNVDFDAALQQLAYFYGNVGKILRKPVDVETMRRAKDEAAAQQAQIQQAQQLMNMEQQAQGMEQQTQ
jgi:hypothetical protein